MLKKIWTVLSGVATVLVIKRQLETLNSAREEFYDSLPEEYKQKYVRIFGNPEANIPVPPAPTYKPVSDLNQVKTGV